MRIIYRQSIADEVLEAVRAAAQENRSIEKIIMTRAEVERLRAEMLTDVRQCPRCPHDKYEVYGVPVEVEP